MLPTGGSSVNSITALLDSHKVMKGLWGAPGTHVGKEEETEHNWRQKYLLE